MCKTGSTSFREGPPPVRPRPGQQERGARIPLFNFPRIHLRLTQLFFVVGFLGLFGCEIVSAGPRPQGQSPGATASIEVHLHLPDGAQFSGVARVRLLSEAGPEVTENSVLQSGRTIIRNLDPGVYIVEASAPGFLTVQETVSLEMKRSSITAFLTMRPENSLKKTPAGLAAPILAPKARKEVEKGLEAFRRNDMKKARKHFEKALKMAPGNPDVQFLMGALELQSNNVAAAQRHLETAIQLFPNHVPSLELLGQLYCQQKQPQKAAALLEKAVSLEDGSWKAHWKLGSAYLQADEPEKARQQAERAISLGKAAAGTAQILKAQALVELGEWDAAEACLATFVHDQPADPSSGTARAFLAQVQKRQQAEIKRAPLALDAHEDFAAIASLRPSALKSENSVWAGPGIDEFVPGVAPNVACSLPQVLKGAGKRVEQLMANLERFTATEQVKHFTVNRMGELRSPQTRSFEYVVFVKQAPNGIIELEEYRNGSTDPRLFPAGIATNGLPSMALVFHPRMVRDFDFACEGLGQVEGRAAWQVHFQQRPDRPNPILAYVIGGNYYSVALKGRAWIDAGTYQIVRLESELVKPMPDIHLTQYHLSIDYAPVQFHSRDLQLWLPQTAEMFVERGKVRFYRTHTFSDFELFSVDVGQKRRAPEESYSFTNLSDQEISGQLTITPLLGRSITPISITFTIPPRRSVFKLVGEGKDLNIPADSIGSARFVYNGAPGAVRADASLTRPSTLEIVPENQPSTTPPK